MGRNSEGGVRAVHPDKVSFNCQQWATRIARVDGGVGAAATPPLRHDRLASEPGEVCRFLKGQAVGCAHRHDLEGR